MSPMLCHARQIQRNGIDATEVVEEPGVDAVSHEGRLNGRDVECGRGDSSCGARHVSSIDRTTPPAGAGGFLVLSVGRRRYNREKGGFTMKQRLGGVGLLV